MAEIKAIEAILSVPLPEDFRAFLEVANGAYLPYLVNVPPTPDGESLAFSRIFTTRLTKGGQSRYGTFLGELRNKPEVLRIPRQVLPFAVDGGGSTLYLDLTNEGTGRVVAFVHGLPAWTGRHQEDAFVEVAPSFSKFVDLLYLDLDNDWTE